MVIALIFGVYGGISYLYSDQTKTTRALEECHFRDGAQDAMLLDLQRDNQEMAGRIRILEEKSKFNQWTIPMPSQNPPQWTPAPLDYSIITNVLSHTNIWFTPNMVVTNGINGAIFLR